MRPANVAVALPAPARQRALKWVLLGVLAAALLIWPLFTHDFFYTHIATLVLLYCIGGASLHLLVRMGQLSLGHAAFMGIGGYTSALLSTRLGWPFIPAFVASAIVPALVALVLGPILLRLRGVYFVMITYSFGELVRLLFNEWQSLTGGADGIFQIPPPHPFLATSREYYYFALLMAVLCVGFTGRLLSSQTGRFIDAIRESDRLAQSSGVPVLRFKVMVFVISCGLVGMQGSLMAHYIHYLSPGAFGFSESLNFLVFNVIGGMQTLAGPIIGAAFLVSLPELLRGWVELQRVLYGVILIVVMLYLPGGLVMIGRRALERLPIGKGER
jgi:branched-chain amino acid transport system permease protein